MFPIDQIRQVPRPAWFLGLGLFANSSMLFAKAGYGMGGVTEVLATQKTLKMRAEYVARLWYKLNHKASQEDMVPDMLSHTLYPASLHLIAAYLTTSKLVRTLSLITAFASITIIPITLGALVPTAHILTRLGRKKRLTACERQGLVYHLNEWNNALLRVSFPCGISWAASLGALLGVAGGW